MRIAHLVGGAASGALLGLVLSLAGRPVPETARHVALGLAAAWVLVGSLAGRSFQGPRRTTLTQVPRDLLGRFGPTWGQVLWGAQLGSGFGTFISVRSFWLVALLLANLPLAAAVAGGLAFGTVRQATAVRLSQRHSGGDVFSFLASGRRVATIAHAVGTLGGTLLAVWIAAS
jgi:hypothetical protein